MNNYTSNNYTSYHYTSNRDIEASRPLRPQVQHIFTPSPSPRESKNYKKLTKAVTIGLTIGFAVVVVVLIGFGVTLSKTDNSTAQTQNKTNTRYSSDAKSVSVTRNTNLGADYKKKYNDIRESVKLQEDANVTLICETDECHKSASALANSMNISVDPCDDFYEFVCGQWSSDHLTKNRTKTSLFTNLDQKSRKMTIDILTETVDESDPKVLNAAKSLFKFCSDVDKLEIDGQLPLYNILEGYGGWPILHRNWSSTQFDFYKSVSDLSRIFSTNAIFEIRVNQEPSGHKIEFFQPSLFIPQSVLLDQVTYQTTISVMAEYMLYIAVEVKSSPLVLSKTNKAKLDLEEMIQQILDVIEFETKIANATKNLITEASTVVYGVSLPLSKLDDYFGYKQPSIYDIIYNRQDSTHKGVSVSLSQLVKSLFRDAGVYVSDTQVVTVTDIEYMKKILAILKDTPKKTIANYLHLRMAYFMAPETTFSMRSLLKPSLNSSKESREHICGATAEKAFSLAIGHKYIKNGFLSMSTKYDVQKMFDSITASYRELLYTTLDWMYPPTHKELMKNVDSLKSCIGFPDWIENTTAVDSIYNRDDFFRVQYDIEQTSGYLRKYLKFTEWLGNKKLKMLKKEINPDCDWAFAALVNAFYLKQFNQIDLPPGVLQFPLFAQNRPNSLNYGALGTLIGHELTHGYSITDVDVLTKPILQKKIERYIKSRECLVNHYDEIESLNATDVHLSGAVTLEENFADVGGLASAYYSLIDHLNKMGPEEKIPGLEEYDSEQLFFISFAHNWCSSASEDRIYNELLVDNHSPSRQRVLGALRNSNEFARAWECPVGSKMNQGETNKCDIF